MNSNKNATIDFLLYSYFGITSCCEKEEMINACIKRAYLDACRTIHFPSRNAFTKSDSKGYYFLTEASAVIHSQLEDALLQDDFHVWHEKTCNRLIAIGETASMKTFYGSAIYLTYGHAQKWVNMTMKYLYLLETLLEKGYIQCDWKKLHVPIDSYIVEAFDNKTEDKTEQILGTATWSNIDDAAKYKNYQQKIADISAKEVPINWEGPAWIEVAKERSKKEQGKKDKRLEELKTILLK